MPNSLRKFIRMEKARIRREVLDTKDQERLILELYKKVIRKPKEQKEESKKPEEKLKEKKVSEKKQKSSLKKRQNSL